ncbi:hypothetical protein GCM10018781_45580 [Kitasatospora indigofera]|uniref:Uncharacterized protein n=1 Tax=Kitasatospora indigofera TaxID=67307 RepID=A0A919G1D2_9ACTN|nr:hypothetical protein [Kitasatospora indigofera]GHH75809.1 hypothetical protein GCM10018781_45580 [Kitasatospora indigofera]
MTEARADRPGRHLSEGEALMGRATEHAADDAIRTPDGPDGVRARLPALGRLAALPSADLHELVRRALGAPATGAVTAGLFQSSI